MIQSKQIASTGDRNADLSVIITKSREAARLANAKGLTTLAFPFERVVEEATKHL